MTRFLLILTLLAPAAGCLYNWDAHLSAGSCKADGDCGESQYCDRGTGICHCLDDRGCGSEEFCNSQNYCQLRSGCLNNDDCPAQQENGQTVERMCNVKLSMCTFAGTCAVDADCPHNQLCDKITAQCKDGCKDNGDCVLGWTCDQGICKQGFCVTNADCSHGESCIVETGECIVDRRGPFCRACQNNRGEPPECEDYANYCLIDSSSAAGYFCGVDCARGQECPSGYQCNNVIILTQSTCGGSRCVNGFCRGMDSGSPCNEDADCDYPLPQGTCQKDGQECRAGEGDVRGHCTCVDDSDCPRDECRDASITETCDNQVCSESGAACSNSADCPGNQLGHCLIGGHRCYDSADCDVIACVNGGCLIGANCAPDEGLTCREMPQ